MLPLLLFFFLLSLSHTLEFSVFPRLLVFPVHKPTTSLEQRSLWALQPLRRHKMSLLMGCWTMKDGGKHLQPQLPLTTPSPLPLSDCAEDEDLGPETTVGSLAGHQQSTYQIEKHIQVGANTRTHERFYCFIGCLCGAIRLFRSTCPQYSFLWVFDALLRHQRHEEERGQRWRAVWALGCRL